MYCDGWSLMHYKQNEVTAIIEGSLCKYPWTPRHGPVSEIRE